MSDQTGDPLAEAQAGLATEQTKCRERALLDRIAVGLPGAIDGIARRTAEPHPRSPGARERRDQSRGQTSRRKPTS